VRRNIHGLCTGYDSAGYVISPNAVQLIEKRKRFQIHGVRRLGQAEQIVATGGKFVTTISGPAYRNPRNVLAEPFEKKIPALSRRAEETQRLARSCSEGFKLA
jgi:hypothetical protein